VGKKLKAIFCRSAAIALVFVFMLIPAACGSPTTGTVVEMRLFQYMPAFLTIDVGTKVTWKNTEDIAHWVTSDIGLFDSGRIDPGDSYSYTFNISGTYRYRSTNEAGMTGTIFVQ